MTYSYDFTVSELGPVSGGAHELALKYKIHIQMEAKSKKRHPSASGYAMIG